MLTRIDESKSAWFSLQSRARGNTEILVREVLKILDEEAIETEIIKVSDLNIAPCNGCQLCRETGDCNIKDDAQTLYEEFMSADCIIFGTPVYFWNVSAQAKIIIDRTYALLRDRKLRGRYLAIIVTGARAGCTEAFSALVNFSILHRMQFMGGAIAYGGFERGDVWKDQRGIEEARALGRAIARAIAKASERIDIENQISQALDRWQLHIFK